MAIFTWPFPKNPSAPPLLGIMALAVAAAAAIMLAAGLLNFYGNPQARTAQAQNAAADRAALVAFYNATDGPNWTNNTGWLTSQPLGEWHGISVNSSGRVTQMILGGNNLTGTIPDEFGNLSKMRLLSLFDNNLTGPIPATLGNLSELERASFRDNSLTGSIPATLGQLNELTAIALYNNSLTGTVPSELGNLNPMEVTSLLLYGNQLTGQLPYSLTRLTRMSTLQFQNNAGLCAPLDSDFQTWFQRVNTRNGPDCPPTRIWTGSAAPVVGEPVAVELTAREHRLARTGVTLDEYENNPCISYTNPNTSAIWRWERADADSNDPNSPDDSTWARVNAGAHINATFVYLPQAGDEGKFLRATLTYGSPETMVTTDAIGPVVADNGLTSGDIVSIAAPAPVGALQVGDHLNVTLPAAAAAERGDPAINPRPEPWQWERSDDGGASWSNHTPYHRHCRRPDSEYPLHAAEVGRHLRSYIYYNDDSSGSVVLKQALSAAAGPVAP